MPSDKPKLIFNIDEDLLERIDDFRYENHFPSRAAAIIWLLKFALKQRPTPKKRKDKE